MEVKVSRTSSLKNYAVEMNYKSRFIFNAVITGRECDIVILTAVRSLPEEDILDHPSHTWVNENLGFLTDEHLMNVAITRAREALCIIGRYCVYTVYRGQVFPEGKFLACT